MTARKEKYSGMNIKQRDKSEESKMKEIKLGNLKAQILLLSEKGERKWRKEGRTRRND